MSEARDFFRICPACGRRFHIKLVNKKLVDERRETIEIKQAMINPTPMGYTKGSLATAPLMVEENIPVTIDVEEFQYSYGCKHCGHVWSEMREKQSKA